MPIIVAAVYSFMCHYIGTEVFIGNIEAIYLSGVFSVFGCVIIIKELS